MFENYRHCLFFDTPGSPIVQAMERRYQTLMEKYGTSVGEKEKLAKENMDLNKVGSLIHNSMNAWMYGYMDEVTVLVVWSK